jgi:hypothetical protein
MYVWRFPLSLLAVNLVTGVLLVVVVAAMVVRRRMNVVVRATLLAGVIVSFIASPPMTDWLIVRLNPTQGIGRTYIDPGGVTLFVPAALVLFLVILSLALFRQYSSSAPATRWRIGFYLFGVATMLANSINLCSPGWCVRFGFPFAYYSWSDAVMVFNGEMPSPWSPAAAALDVIAFAAGSVAMGLAYRRRFAMSPELVPGRNSP